MSARRRQLLLPIAGAVVAVVVMPTAAVAADVGSSATRESSGAEARSTSTPAAYRPGSAKPGDQVRLISGPQALAIARSLPKVRAEARKHRDAHWDTELKGGRWRLQLWTDEGDLAVEVFVERTGGKVVEQWTGYQAAWGMARGYPGAFGRSSTALWVWVPLLGLFLFGLVPRGRPNARTGDVLAVAALSIPFAGFNTGRIWLSTPALYPPMLWLLGRMLWRGLRRESTAAPRPGWVPLGWMAIVIVFLVGFRVALVVADGNMIDVGEASVIGGDRLASGKEVYGHFPKRIERGDTYGPTTWAAYAPFAAIVDVDTKEGAQIAASAAAITFDLLCLLGLALLGYRLRGPPGAAVAAWFWVTCPFTLYVAMCAANDGLVALAGTLVLLSLTVDRRGGAVLRGAAVMFDALTKLAGLALLPMFARRRGSSGIGAVFSYSLGAVVVLAFAMVPHLADPLAVWERTIGFQDGRGAPFTAWGLYGLPDWSRTAWQVLAVLLALAVAFVPRAANRDLKALAALSVAVLIAVELSAVYWFYTYIVWFLPALAVVVIGDVTPWKFPGWAAAPVRSAMPANPSPR